MQPGPPRPRPRSIAAPPPPPADRGLDVKGGLRSLGRNAFASLDVCENVLLPNATADPGAARPERGRRRACPRSAGPRASRSSSDRRPPPPARLRRRRAARLPAVVCRCARRGAPRPGEPRRRSQRGGSDRDGVARRDQDALEAAGGRRRDLDVDLVGGDVADGLVGLHPVAGPLAPFDDRPLRDGDAHLGHALILSELRASFSSARRALHASFMSSSWGRVACSSGGLNGIGTSGAVSRRTGASRSSKACSVMSAATSAPTPHERVASCATSAFPVLRTLASTASRSSGQRLRRSRTSMSSSSSSRRA